MLRVSVLVAGLLGLANGLSSPQPRQNIKAQIPHKTTQQPSRREALTFAVTSAVATVGLVQPPPNAWADSSGAPTTEDLNRLKLGYKQIRYLLDNFDAETTVCRENGGECKRDADAIRRALGLRTTTDPLFQIEKVFAKVKNMDLDPDALDAFFDAAEEWSSAVNMSNSMAFISQFGEYNPGGGQDEVLKYLNESKKQLVMAESALSTIMKSLGVPPN
ncbi:hypothetical protein ACA910_017999 [Epithemia clementina (nom. ined.)]